MGNAQSSRGLRFVRSRQGSGAKGAPPGTGQAAEGRLRQGWHGEAASSSCFVAVTEDGSGVGAHIPHQAQRRKAKEGLEALGVCTRVHASALVHARRACPRGAARHRGARCWTASGSVWAAVVVRRSSQGGACCGTACGPCAGAGCRRLQTRACRAAPHCRYLLKHDGRGDRWSRGISRGLLTLAGAPQPGPT